MQQLDQVKEYFRKLKMVEEFVDGNTEIAKMILDGVIKDIIVIKGRFKNNDDNCYGLFMIFINKLHPGVIRTSNIISKLPSLYRHKPLEPSFEFQRLIDKELAHGTHDKEKTQFFSNVIDRFVSNKNVKDIIVWIDGNLILDITNFFTNLVTDMLSIEEPTVLIDFENISSVQFLEKSGLDIHALQPEKNPCDEDV